jgi:signal transduction histidine kinase
MEQPARGPERGARFVGYPGQSEQDRAGDGQPAAERRGRAFPEDVHRGIAGDHIDGAVVAEGIRLQVRDNGPGIDGAAMDKIFDPFFTTKEVGKGMGLGLSICYRIMQEAGGQISVRSEPGRFTEFILLFPKPGR